MNLQNLTHILIGIVCIGLLPNAQAVVPAPDGGYPGGNTAEGQSALFSLTTGGYNTGVGFLSLSSNSTTSFNTAIGAGTLLVNTADGNTATGAGALFSNTSGPSNTATGAFALFSNTTNGGNTANGYQALFNNTAFGNTADGYQTLYNNTTGHENAANGGQALFSNAEGSANTASGIQALWSNINGNDNTACGFLALHNNTTGANNTAVGAGALSVSTTGINNVAVGTGAGSDVTTGSLNIDIGNVGVADDDNIIRIGDVQTRTFIAGIYGVTEGGTPAAVYINSSGQLGTSPSSRRFKKDIKPMDQASEAILSFKPVTFHYKSDTADTPQFGLVAEEVAGINPDLVARDRSGEIYTVRYEAVNAMLLNEFLKEHRKVEAQESKIKEQRCKVQEQEATITQLTKDFRTTVVQLTTRLDEQASQIQKVSDQLAAANPFRGELELTAPQIVLNSR